MAVTAQGDNTNLLLQVAGTLNRAKSIGLLTDSMVSGAATRAVLKQRIDALAVHNDAYPAKIDLKRAIDVSGLTDSDVNSVSTAAALIALIPVTTTSQAVLN